MDIQMPEMNGLDALIAIRTGFSDAVHGLPISQIGLIASLIRGLEQAEIAFARLLRELDLDLEAPPAASWPASLRSPR
jgi:CheY-like chemotaxis protein